MIMMIVTFSIFPQTEIERTLKQNKKKLKHKTKNGKGNQVIKKKDGTISQNKQEEIQNKQQRLKFLKRKELMQRI